MTLYNLKVYLLHNEICLRNLHVMHGFIISFGRDRQHLLVHDVLGIYEFSQSLDLILLLR